jgi:hypothetical protein
MKNQIQQQLLDFISIMKYNQINKLLLQVTEINGISLLHCTAEWMQRNIINKRQNIHYLLNLIPKECASKLLY